MQQIQEITDFLANALQYPVLDVRSPGEFAQGHIPGANSFPLFTDDERAQVGTAYKQQSKEAAFLLGLEIVGPKMAQFVRDARRIAPEGKVLVHCWRGGQRSGSMAWLLRQAGLEVATLSGGYKNYRTWLLEDLHRQQLNIRVIGGPTGSGKTHILHALREQGEQIIDLEAIAHHKGSAFGFIGEQPQPTVEQFENNLYAAVRQLDTARRVWVENESHSIGRVYIPDGFWTQMKASRLYQLAIPLEVRIQNLLKDYVLENKDELAIAFHKIASKLGGLRLKQALEALERHDFATAAGIALEYYDKTYQHGLQNNTSPDIRHVAFDHGNPEMIARHLRELDLND